MYNMNSRHLLGKMSWNNRIVVDSIILELNFEKLYKQIA